MTIDNKENLIFNDLEGKTQCISKEEIKKAWEYFKERKTFPYKGVKDQEVQDIERFCANYERDNIETLNKDSVGISEYLSMDIKYSTMNNNNVKINPITEEKDLIVEEVRNDLLKRSQVGIKKYGTTLSDNKLELKEWLQHAYEECLDQANYLKSAILKLKDEKTT